MARIYSDEDFPRPVSDLLRTLGHDVLTCSQSGRASKKIADDLVLDYAISQGRTVLTYNRGHFEKLHQKNKHHFGIIVCTVNNDFAELSQCIHEKLLAHSNLAGELIKVYRPHKPKRKSTS